MRVKVYDAQRVARSACYPTCSLHHAPEVRRINMVMPMDVTTVIIEQASNDACRVWWTPDDIVDITPHQVPDETDLDYMRLDEPLPFVRWCSEKYTSPDTGRALLTQLPIPLPHGLLTTEFVRANTSITNVIATVKLA